MAPRDSIDTVMDRLEPFLDVFSSIPNEALSLYRSYPPKVLPEHSPRTAANCIYDHMVMASERAFVNRSDIRPLVVKGLKLWLIGSNQHTVIRWKKMDEDGKSRNYPTQQAKDFDFQRELEGLPPKPTRVTVGYLLDPSATFIRRVQVARPHGKRIDWCAAIIPPERRAAVAGKKWEDVTKQADLLG